MSKLQKDREIVTLSDREHILTRPGMYIGGVEPIEHVEWVLTDDKLSREKITYTPAICKIINEVIDNSIDEGIKTNWKYSTKIAVKISEGKVSVEDNGRGLPVEQNAAGDWMPVIAVCNARTGSNFVDDNSESIGTHGLGVKATNIFSTQFTVNTCDGKKRMKIVCKDNLSSTKSSFLTTNIDKTGTKIEFEPDFKRFGVDGISPAVISLLKTRLRMLSWFFPNCTITFNGEKMGLKAREISTMFPQPCVFFNTDSVYIAAYKSEEPEFMTYVNGISLGRGGSHVDYVSTKIITDVREKLMRRYKNIKPNDIKNRLGFVILFKDFPNCQFDSQTKELLTNNEKDVKAYLEDIDLTAKLSKKILADKDMVANITDMFRLKEELAEKKALQKMNVKKRDIDSEKYFPPVGPRKYLMITEGYSAFSGLSAILGRKGIGFYALKGKIMNIQGMNLATVMKNQEVSDLINILGIDITNPENTDLNFDKIVFSSDQDLDGIHIRSLLITLFHRFCPNLFKEGRIAILNTPLLIGLNKKNKVEQYFFEFPAADTLNKSLRWKYIKGLGGWNKSELDQVIQKEGGLDGLLLTCVKDADAATCVDKWFGNNSELRKEALRGRSFSTDKI